jgi:Uma2 family endonuclease
MMQAMSAIPRHARYTLDEYRRLEEYSNVKHEFLDGAVYAMGGGTPEHGARAMRIGAALVSQLRGKRCVEYSSDVRIKIAASGLFTYPDVSVVCGAEQRDKVDPHALTNPVVLVEVTSPSTAAYDRGEKLEHYKLLPSVQEVVIVAREEPRIEVWRRAGSGWVCVTARAHETVQLLSVGCVLAADEVFADPLRQASG